MPILDLFGLTENTEVALVTGIASICVAMVSAVFAYLAQRRSRETHDQVTNQHSTNLRDDIDDIKRSVDVVATTTLLHVERLQGIDDHLEDGRKSFAEINAAVAEVRGDVRYIRQDLGRTDSRLDDVHRAADIVHSRLEDRINDLERKPRHFGGQ